MQKRKATELKPPLFRLREASSVTRSKAYRSSSVRRFDRCSRVQRRLPTIGRRSEDSQDERNQGRSGFGGSEGYRSVLKYYVDRVMRSYENVREGNRIVQNVGSTCWVASYRGSGSKILEETREYFVCLAVLVVDGYARHDVHGVGMRRVLGLPWGLGGGDRGVSSGGGSRELGIPTGSRDGVADSLRRGARTFDSRGTS
ncbi:hypothetical protein EDB92DRAFT_1812304 [Lactarius akahatsu]|uniref:Uncharacterized protein n=1 Tax=Lactarius akahatsu TaxID=416441 RepID=A0AAD4LUQ1_9AGAM|nr:hypothetical protein EDB92DRAFT_1812304 [Lactarius akahatsu]